MRNLTILLVLILFTFQVKAQDFKPFKLGIGVGMAAPGEGSGVGALVYLEPAYRLSDEITLGLRLEAAALTRIAIDESNTSLDYSISGIASYTVNGQYYFSNTTFRPFIGAGLGLFAVTAVEVEEFDDPIADASTKFGFYPRVGFDLGHFTMAFEYNFVGNSAIEGSDSEIQNNYFGIKVGGFFFGGRY